MKIKDLEDYLTKWPRWIAILMIFIPGILYQIQYKSVDIANFNGMLIIILLMLSLYYSIPFIVLAFFMFVWGEKVIPNQFGDEDFFIIMINTLLVYASLNFLTIKTNTNIWIIYLIFVIFLFIIGIKKWIKLFKQMRLENKK